MRHLALFLIVCCLETTWGTLSVLEDTVDLTWPFDRDSIYWTGVQPFTLTKRVAEVRLEGFWYAANEFCAGEHGGTHFDAPYHFNKRGWKVGQVPLSRLIVRGIKIDISDEVEILKDKARLLPEHLEEWENRNGPIPNNVVLLVNFGWSQYYSNKTKYLGIDKEGKLNFPGVSEAAAKWIVKTNKIVGVGIDIASVDPGRSPNFPVHRILGENQIYLLENVKIPSIFPETGFTLYVMPMKIQDGTGAPLRLIAVPSGSTVLPLCLAATSPAVPKYNSVIIILSSVVLFLLYGLNDSD